MPAVRTGPLTWAQQEWFADVGIHSDTPSSHLANLHVTIPVDGLPVGEVIAAVRDVAHRHEGLRTLRVAGGQSVEDVDERLGEVIRIGTAVGGTCFALDRQWPVLFTMAAAGGVVGQVDVEVDHWAVDAWGMRVLRADLERALRSASSPSSLSASPLPLPAAGVEQPVDTAWWEAGREGVAQARRAETYWRQRLAHLRESLGDWSSPDPPEPAAPRQHSCRLASRAAAVGATSIAAATGLPRSAVYLLAFGDAIRAMLGAPAIGLTAIVANRTSPGVRASVRKAAMSVPIVVPPDGTFPARLARCAGQLLHGSRHANLPPATAAAVRVATLGDLDRSGATSVRFNYVDDSVIGSAADSRSMGRDRVPYADRAVHGHVTFIAPRPGGSRFVVTARHRPTGVLLTAAWHADTVWEGRAADLLYAVEHVLTKTAT